MGLLSGIVWSFWGGDFGMDSNFKSFCFKLDCHFNFFKLDGHFLKKNNVGADWSTTEYFFTCKKVVLQECLDKLVCKFFRSNNNTRC